MSKSTRNIIKNGFSFYISVPSAPDVPRLMNTTNTSIAVAWERPSVTNGVIRYYSVNYNKHSIKVNSFQHAALKDFITPFRDYRVSVSACTSKGCSQPSLAINVTTEIGGDLILKITFITEKIQDRPMY